MHIRYVSLAVAIPLAALTASAQQTYLDTRIDGSAVCTGGSPFVYTNGSGTTTNRCDARYVSAQGSASNVSGSLRNVISVSTPGAGPFSAASASLTAQSSWSDQLLYSSSGGNAPSFVRFTARFSGADQAHAFGFGGLSQSDGSAGFTAFTNQGSPGMATGAHQVYSNYPQTELSFDETFSTTASLSGMPGRVAFQMYLNTYSNVDDNYNFLDFPPEDASSTFSWALTGVTFLDSQQAAMDGVQYSFANGTALVSTPEPATAVLLLTGLAGLAFRRRRA